MQIGNLYEIQLHRKGHPVAARIARGRCACTQQPGPWHDWTEQCDRFPPLALVRVDGTEIDLSELRLCMSGHDLGLIIDAKRVGERRYRYLADLELWALQHCMRHPITRPDRAARKWRTFLND